MQRFAILSFLVPFDYSTVFPKRNPSGVLSIDAAASSVVSFLWVLCVQNLCARHVFRTGIRKLSRHLLSFPVTTECPGALCKINEDNTESCLTCSDGFYMEGCTSKKRKATVTQRAMT